MPPKAHPHPHRPPSTALAGFIDERRIDDLLRTWVPDERDRAFVVRCLLREGFAHHRGSNYVLLALLGELAAEVGAVGRVAGASAPVPLRLPPHLERDADADDAFPIPLPLAPLERRRRRGAPSPRRSSSARTCGTRAARG